MLFVESCDALEQTSGPYSKSTRQKLVGFALSSDASQSHFSVRWDSEGNHGAQTGVAALTQARAHFNATSILYPKCAPMMSMSELTADRLRQIHRTLFDQSLNEGSEWLVGRFRHENLSAGDYDFRRVDNEGEMRALVENLMERLKYAMATEQEGFIIASWFLSQFLMLHPFANGTAVWLVCCLRTSPPCVTTSLFQPSFRREKEKTASTTTLLLSTCRTGTLQIIHPCWPRA